MKTLQEILQNVQQQNLSSRFRATTTSAQQLFVYYVAAESLQTRINRLNSLPQNVLFNFFFIGYDELDECLYLESNRYKTLSNNQFQWISSEQTVNWVKTINNEYGLTYPTQYMSVGEIMQNQLPLIEKII